MINLFKVWYRAGIEMCEWLQRPKSRHMLLLDSFACMFRYCLCDCVIFFQRVGWKYVSHQKVRETLFLKLISSVLAKVAQKMNLCRLYSTHSIITFEHQEASLILQVTGVINFFHAHLNWTWNFNCSHKLKCWKIKTFLAFKLSDVVSITLINLKCQQLLAF